MDLVRNIKKERLNSKLSQAQMASRSGISQSYYSRIESGNSTAVPFHVVVKIYQQLGYNIILQKINADI